MEQALSTLLLNYFFIPNTSIKFLAELIIAIIRVREVNLKELSLAISASSTQDSCYRRLQRLFTNLNFNYKSISLLLITLAGLEEVTWILALDRTNWKFGKKYINVLMLSICYNGIAIPLMWDLLDNNGGSSNFADRKKLILRFIKYFGAKKIHSLLMDREFIGDDWLQFLDDQQIHFYVRLKENHTISRSRGELSKTANRLIKHLENGCSKVLFGKRFLGAKRGGGRLSVLWLVAMKKDL